MIFVDLDGVLVDFHGCAAEEFGTSADQFTGWAIWEPMGIPEKAFWKWLSSRSRQWWADLPPYPWMGELLDMVAAHDPDYRILTAPSRGNSISGKLDWIEHHLGTKCVERAHFTKKKADLAGNARLLIDDVDANCEEFSAAGGKFILFPQPWNKASDISTPRMKFVAENLEFRKEFLCPA